MVSSAVAEAGISLTSPLLSDSDAARPGVPNGGATGADGVSWDRIIDDLLRLRALPNDWDGQGSLALDAAIVDQVIAWVKEMRRWRRALPPTFVHPGTLGEVVVEWRRGSFHLAAEIGEPGQIDWVLNLPGQPIKQWQTDAHGPWIVRADD